MNYAPFDGKVEFIVQRHDDQTTLDLLREIGRLNPEINEAKVGNDWYHRPRPVDYPEYWASGKSPAK